MVFSESSHAVSDHLTQDWLRSLLHQWLQFARLEINYRAKMLQYRDHSQMGDHCYDASDYADLYNKCLIIHWQWSISSSEAEQLHLHFSKSLWSRQLATDV